METRPYHSKTALSVDIQALGRQISEAQGPDGEIPWNSEGKTDPWDLVESAMGLSIAGNLEKARSAYEWMTNKQLPDGCWYAAYGNGIPKDKTKDANMSTYIAVGVLHYYLITGDKRFLFEMWETVEKAIDFALRLQAPGGEIYWAINPKGEVDPMADLKQLRSAVRCPLAIAGGIKLADIDRAMDLGADIVVVGSGIAAEPDPRDVARRIMEKIKET